MQPNFVHRNCGSSRSFLYKACILQAGFQRVPGVRPMTMKRPSTSTQFRSPSIVTPAMKKRSMEDASSSVDAEPYEYIADIDAKKGFGIAEECLNSHQRFMTKHEMVLGIHLNARLPLGETSFSPQRKWRYLSLYLLDFAKFLEFEYVTKRLQQLRMSALSKHRAQFAAICEA